MYRKKSTAVDGPEKIHRRTNSRAYDHVPLLLSSRE
jgi:hypothetical protein